MKNPCYYLLLPPFHRRPHPQRRRLVVVPRNGLEPDGPPVDLAAGHRESRVAGAVERAGVGDGAQERLVVDLAEVGRGYRVVERASASSSQNAASTASANRRAAFRAATYGSPSVRSASARPPGCPRRPSPPQPRRPRGRRPPVGRLGENRLPRPATHRGVPQVRTADRFERAAFSTESASGPTWSSDGARSAKPNRETVPRVGFGLTTPQNDAGIRIDPPVSEPSATSPVATAASLPNDDPPGVAPSTRGFRMGPCAHVSPEVKDANPPMSSVFEAEIGRIELSRRAFGPRHRGTCCRGPSDRTGGATLSGNYFVLSWHLIVT